MSIAQQLKEWIHAGIHRIGEIHIHTDLHGKPFVLCHHQDSEAATEADFGGLEGHEDPQAARDISTHAEDGSYRFAKAQMNLKRGWVMPLADEHQLRQALDLFYPAAAALIAAHRDGSLEVQHMRDKLNRQTGMYRYARNISDAGAQQLIREVCGPNHQCAKRILWQIDGDTPLEDSEASRFKGIGQVSNALIAHCEADDPVFWIDIDFAEINMFRVIKCAHS